MTCFFQAVDTGDTITFTGADQCRMEKLVLNFADIGWEDWVIYPKGFETNYCAGGCLFPLGKGSKPTNHATVQSLARSFGRLWDVPEPSCVPDTLAPLTLLYMDRSNHVLLKSYPDMRVVTCSCKWRGCLPRPRLWRCAPRQQQWYMMSLYYATYDVIYLLSDRTCPDDLRGHIKI